MLMSQQLVPRLDSAAPFIRWPLWASQPSSVAVPNTHGHNLYDPAYAGWSQQPGNARNDWPETTMAKATIYVIAVFVLNQGNPLRMPPWRYILERLQGLDPTLHQKRCVISSTNIGLWIPWFGATFGCRWYIRVATMRHANMSPVLVWGKRFLGGNATEIHTFAGTQSVCSLKLNHLSKCLSYHY